MLSYLKIPAIVLAGLISFLALLSFQSPLQNTWNDSKGSRALTLVEVAAGCQPAQPFEAMESISYDLEDLNISRITPPENGGNNIPTGFTDFAVVNDNIVIEYQNTLEPFEYTTIAEVALNSLTDDLIPLYLIPSEGSLDRGLLRLYKDGLMQECVELNPNNLKAFINK